MDNSTYQNGILQTKRTIQYSPDEIYATFSDPTRLAKWWGPNNFTNTFETFEFITGGHWNFLMRGPDGHDYPNKSVFKELLTGEKLVIEHISPPRFTLSVFLSPIENGTQVHWVQEFEDPTVAEAVRHIAVPGNEQNLDRLEMHLRGEL